jgi:hypothetical protein
MALQENNPTLRLKAMSALHQLTKLEHLREVLIANKVIDICCNVLEGRNGSQILKEAVITLYELISPRGTETKISFSLH